MTETKTFKNPYSISSDVGHDTSVVTWNIGGHCFESLGWDLEVTFTKKEPPLAVGDTIKYDNWSDTKVATIMAIDNDQCWLRFSDGSHATWDLDEVRR